MVFGGCCLPYMFCSLIVMFLNQFIGVFELFKIWSFWHFLYVSITIYLFGIGFVHCRRPYADLSLLPSSEFGFWWWILSHWKLHYSSLFSHWWLSDRLWTLSFLINRSVTWRLSLPLELITRNTSHNLRIENSWIYSTKSWRKTKQMYVSMLNCRSTTQMHGKRG